MAHLRNFIPLLILSLLIITACESNLQTQVQEINDQDLDQLQKIASEHNNGVLYSNISAVKKVEQFKNKLSNTYENFGGVYFDNDNKKIVLSIKNIESNSIDQNAVNSLKGLIRDNFNENSAINSEYEFKIKKVQFSFRELQTYRDLLGPIIHQREDVVESYINLKENKFSIGLLENAKKEDYNSLIDKYSLPKKAISFYTTTPYEISIGSSSNLISQSNHTVRDRYRPLQGGLQITSLSEIECTFGFNVKLDGEDMWVTNSHCTNTIFGNDNTTYHQNLVGANNLIGTEFRDLQAFGPPGAQYRYSDAALFDLENGVQTRFGAVSNTDNYSFTWGTSGSITINSLFPYQNIYGDGLQYLDGALIYKVGRTTGMTRGSVDATCIDVSNVVGLPSGFTMRCQIRSTTYAGPGDSGSPVFYSQLYYPSARLIGIHWASNDNEQRSVHSPISSIKSELTQGNETMTTH